MANRPNYPLFDWLRFALASIVALGHEGVIGWEPAAGVAVQVFFALSGWLIGGILLDAKLSDLPRFYFNRVTRIWIPYLFTVAALYLVSLLRHDPIDAQWCRFLFYDVTFTHNWFALLPTPDAALAVMPQHATGNHFWSIAVEEQFYLGTPLLISFVIWSRSFLSWLVLALAFIAIGQPSFASVSLGVCSVCATRRWKDRHLRHAAIIAVAAVISAYLIAQPSYIAYGVPFFAASVVALLARTGRRHSIGEFFGGISYPFYLNAWLGVFAVNFIFWHMSLGALQAARYIVSVAVASLTYLLIDRQVMRHRSDWYSPTIGKASMLLAYTVLAIGVIGGIYMNFYG